MHRGRPIPGLSEGGVALSDDLPEVAARKPLTVVAHHTTTLEALRSARSAKQTRRLPETLANLNTCHCGSAAR